MSATKDSSRKRPRSGSTPRAKGDADKGQKNSSRDALFQAIEPMRPLLNMIKDAIVISDIEGNIVEVNNAGLTLSRCTREEFIGRNAIEVIAEKDRQAAIDSLMKQTDGAEPVMTECTFVTPDDTEIEVDFTSSFINDSSGSPVGTMTICRDITERKRMEADLEKAAEKLQIIIESIGDMLFITDLDLNIVNANEAALRALGYSSEEELIGKSAAALIAQKDRARITVFMGKSLAGKGGGSTIEYTIVTSDGKEFDVEANTEILHDCAGMTVGLIITARDVTERKRMQAEVQKAAEKLNTVLESMSDGVIVLDMFGNITEANDTAVHMFEYSIKEELIGKSAMDTIAERDRQKCADAISQSLESGKTPGALEFVMITATGTEFDAELATSMLHDSQSNLTGFVGVIRNITERKRMQEELEKSAEKLRTVIESIGDMLFITDMDLNLTNVNEAAARLLGYADREKLIGKNAMDSVAAKDRARIAIDMAKALSGQNGSEIMAYTLVSAEGTTFDVESNSEILRDCSGQTVGLIITARDVTERKRMQEAVRASEEKMRTMFNSIKDGIVVTDMMGSIVEGNDAAFHMAGYESLEEISGKNPVEFISEKDRPRLVEDLTDFFETGQAAEHLEYTMMKKGGAEFDIELNITALHDADGNTTGFIAVERDVTERRRMQEELRKTAEKLRIMFETVGDMFIVTDMNLNIVNANEASARLLGYSSNVELAGKSVADLISSKDRATATKTMKKTLKTKTGSGTSNLECKFITTAGEEFDVEATTDLLRDCSGMSSGLIITARDVTDRKQMEAAVQESSEKLRATFDAMQDGIFISTLDGHILDSNEAAARLHGYASKEDIIGVNAVDLVAERDREKVMNYALEAMKEGSCLDRFEYTVLKADGSEFDGEFTTVPLRDKSGEIVGWVSMTRDITESKHMLEVLRDSEEKKRLIFESLKEMIMVVNLKGNVVEANDSSISLLGYTKEELVGMSTLEFVAEKDREGAIESAIKLVSVGVADDYIDYTTLALVNKVGEEVEVEYSTALMRDSIGKPTAVIGIAHDISERRRMEKELIESAEKLKSMFESIKDPVIVSDMMGNILDVNDAALRISGWSREKWTGINALEVVHEKDRQAVVESLMKQMEEGPNEELTECTFVVGDGRELEVDFSSSLIHDSSGQPIGTVTVARDITERKRAEMAIRESEEKLRAIFNSVRDGILVIDLEGNFKEFNEATMSMTGYSREELAGKSAFEFILEEDREKVVQDMSTTLTDKHTQALTSYRLLAKGGKVFDAELSSGMMLDSEGNPIALIGVMRDVTDRKQIEDKLVKAKEDLERSNKELEQFAYVASHDLQEPLRMVSSYLKLLERRSKDKLDTEAQEFIDFAVDGSTRMAAMIQALLTYSRVGTRGKPFEPTDCEDIFNKAISNLQIAIEDKDAVVTHDPLPTILADGTQMLQLFQNLIGNGLKFQDNKRPEVQVSVEDRGEDWVFSFRDNGIGIDPKYKDRIFVIFERLHGKGEYKGTGIGLAVCKKIVERHAGQIWVDSTPGNGATFYFTMPKLRKEPVNAGN
jgi:PAS domain S-box-containing protein